MRNEPMTAADRAYIREVFNSTAGTHFLAQLVALRPPIKGDTLEQSAMSAREASGYERALANMSALITDPISAPEVKRVHRRGLGMNTAFQKELLKLLKTYAAGNAGTPDFILAHYLLHCLEAWNEAIVQRDKWQARDEQTTVVDPDDPENKGEAVKNLDPY